MFDEFARPMKLAVCRLKLLSARSFASRSAASSLHNRRSPAFAALRCAIRRLTVAVFRCGGGHSSLHQSASCLFGGLPLSHCNVLCGQLFQTSLHHCRLFFAQSFKPAPPPSSCWGAAGTRDGDISCDGDGEVRGRKDLDRRNKEPRAARYCEQRAS